MPAFKLPVHGDAPSISEENGEALSAFLAPVNHESITQRIGNERIMATEGDLILTQGNKFKNREGWVQGYRYLLKDEDQNICAGLNLTRIHQDRKTHTIVSNVYVLPEGRRQGLASRLLNRAKQDFPNLKVDNCLTVRGAALFGVEAVVSTMGLARKAPRP